MEGGLGFRTLHEFNKVMLAKQVWRHHTEPNTLAAKLIKAKYSDILQAKMGTRTSYLWISLYQSIWVIK